MSGARHDTPVADPTFMDQAACRGMNQDLFLPEKADAQWSYARARKVCAVCPVRVECLRFALDMREQFGMWGGCTPEERDTLRFERRWFEPTEALAKINRNLVRS